MPYASGCDDIELVAISDTEVISFASNHVFLSAVHQEDNKTWH